MMRVVRWIGLIVVLASAAWLWITPRRTYDRFVRAVAFGDATALEATVNFPALRMNLREDLQAGLQRSAGGGLSTTLAGALLGSMVDAAVAPEGLAQILTGFGTRVVTEEDAESLRNRATTSFRYRSFSTVEVALHPAGRPDETGGVLTFVREGLTWKLTRAHGGDR